MRDVGKQRGADLPAGVLTDDLQTVLADKSIVAVALLIGGLEPERTIMLRLLEAGKDVVTANKALLAEHGPELFDRARELGRSIAFEAAVAGGIPIIANISQCLSANEITQIHAILNGTSNYILTRMEEEACDYAAALSAAQQAGYAEADPTMDVDGSDAAQKLAILAHLAFGARVKWREIPRRGIATLDPADMRYAARAGPPHQAAGGGPSLGTAGLELHVSPTLVKTGTPLAEVRGVYNAIAVVGDAVGRVFFHGKGAGMMPTASAVVADLIDTVVGRTRITFRTLELWSNSYAQVSPRDPHKVPGRYYLRFTVEDRPGVMSIITGVLGHHEVSIASVIQHEPETPEAKAVPLVIMTHRTTEGATARAVEEIDRLDCVRGSSVRMRVHE